MRVEDHRGYTLVEVMVALVIVSILGIAMMNLFRAQHQVQARQNTGVERTMGARAALDMMAREMRNAGYNPRRMANTGFIKTDVTEVEWTADLNGDGDVDDTGPSGDERVRYFLDIQRGELVRDAAGVQVVVADHVSGLTLTYLNEELAEVASGEEIEQVNIRLTYDTPAGTMTGAMDTQVAIRNQIFEASACATSPVLLVNGDLEISGKLNLLGCSKSLHVNGNLKVGGDPIMEGAVSVTGSVDGENKLSDTSGDPVDVQEGAGEVDIEKITNPTVSHCDDADYLLTSQGKVKDLATGVEYDATSSSKYGWKRSSSSPVMWDYSSDVEFPGTFCVEGNVSVSGDPGKGESSAMKWTIIAKGSIEISGAPWVTADDPSGYLLLAGGDVKLGGDVMGSLTNFTGNVYAYGHCEVSGKPKYKGQMVCAGNSDPGYAKNHTNSNKISGDMVITYGCAGDC